MHSASRSVVKNILMRGAAVLPSLPFPSHLPLNPTPWEGSLEMTFLSRVMGAAEVESTKQTYKTNECVLVGCGGERIYVLC